MKYVDTGFLACLGKLTLMAPSVNAQMKMITV